MPLQKIQLRPGVNRESTNYANEGGWFDSEKVRFRSGFPQKIGGWISLSDPSLYSFKGVARALWVWVTLAFQNIMAVCTNQKVYIESGGDYKDITPLSATRTLANNPIDTVSGSKVVTITDSGHGQDAGTFVTFSGATAVGGLTISGEYEIVTTPNGNTYTIASATAASSTANGGGAAVVAAYQYGAGNAVYVQGTGWGAGVWGRGTWGSAATVGIGQQMRLWSVDNFGEDLVFAARSGQPFYWDVDTTSYARAVTLEAYANTQLRLTSVAATFGLGVSTITVPLSAVPYLSPGCVVSGTGLVGGQYITTAWDYSTSVPISAVTTLASAGTYTFSYPGRFVPNTTLQVMAAHNQRFIIMFGANTYDPTNFDTTFNPMLVRWSDQENASEWVPSSINQSGEYLLSAGSIIVAARSSRQENLIWTDSALYSMQYIGPPYVWNFSMLNHDNLSVASPNSMIIVNGIAFWMGIEKFYVYTGKVDTLNCSVRQFVFNNINKDQMFQTVCGTNEAWNEVWWHYPSVNSNVNDSYVIYNYLENIWYYGTMNRTAWLDSPLRQYPMAVLSSQNSYLGSDITSASTTISLVNGSSYPSSGTVLIESEYITYTGITNDNLTGCVRGALNTTAASHKAYTPVSTYPLNQVLYHEYGADDNSSSLPVAINAYIQSSDFDIGDGHNFGFVWRMLPDASFDGSTVNQPYLTMVVKPRQNSGTPYGNPDALTVTSANDYSNTKQYTVQEYTGEVFTRVRGRQMSFRMESDSVGTMWQLGAVRIDIRPDGRR